MVKHVWDKHDESNNDDKPGSHVVPTQPQEKEYVHVPGTTHLNAFEADVEEAAKTLAQATAAYEAAKQRLQAKKVESGVINGNQ